MAMKYQLLAERLREELEPAAPMTRLLERS